jgi:purine-nucleoside phosphorylase
MNSEKLVRKAGESLGSAAEIYNQLAAVSSFEQQGLLARERAIEEIYRLAFEMQKEAQNVCTLLDIFLKREVKTS